MPARPLRQVRFLGLPESLNPQERSFHSQVNDFIVRLYETTKQVNSAPIAHLFASTDGHNPANWQSDVGG